MNLERLSYVVQILSGMVLIVGVWLVVVELRQTRELAQIQLLSDAFESIRILSIGQMGEGYPEAMQRVCDGEPLGARDAAVLAARYTASVALAGRSLRMRSLGFDDEFWEGNVRGALASVLTSTHGRAWWREMRGAYLALSPRLVAVADAMIANLPEPRHGCSPALRAIIAAGQGARID